MATFQELAQETIELHEKLNYSENTAIRARVLDAENRAIQHIWSWADWTFKIRMLTPAVYDVDDGVILPYDFLSFQHTGKVFLLNGSGNVQSEMQYMPINRMMGLLYGPSPERGIPTHYSLGGTLDGTGNQRSLFLYPKPNDDVNLTLIYQAVAPTATMGEVEEEDPVLPMNWEEEIPSIPANWHRTVIREVMILFRLMDKSADITAQAAIVKTAKDAMMRDEPHGREDLVRMAPAYGWRMNIRYS